VVGTLAAARPRCSKCNSPPINGQCIKLSITLLLYNGPLLRGYNVPVKGLNTVPTRRRSKCLEF